ncbi:hypothetical protein T4B_5229, partial [Trichinella pseudospiralis]
MIPTLRHLIAEMKIISFTKHIDTQLLSFIAPHVCPPPPPTTFWTLYHKSEISEADLKVKINLHNDAISHSDMHC